MQKTQPPITLVLLFILLTTLTICSTAPTSCSGSCPLGNCPQCLCGSQIQLINIDKYCNQYPWDKECCKCIISKTSGGNKNYIYYEQPWYFIGVMRLDQEDYVSQCGYATVEEWCNVDNNRKCAYRVFQADGKKWTNWYDEAVECGCEVGEVDEDYFQNEEEEQEEQKDIYEEDDEDVDQYEEDEYEGGLL